MAPYAEGEGAPPPACGGAAAALDRRDSVLEDEVFHCGYFADVVFKFRGGKQGEIEEVYGQRGIFALLSPTLRELLFSGKSEGLIDPGNREEVWLPNVVTAQGFRQIARYVYRLPLRLTTWELPEVLAAAHALAVAELEEAALNWGLAALRARRGAGGDEPNTSTFERCQEEGDAAGDALRCLAQLTAMSESREHVRVVTWRDALLSAYSMEDIISSPDFCELPVAALLSLVECEVTARADAAGLWQACVGWAAKSAELEPAPRSLPSNTGAAPRRLFSVGARQHTVAPPPPPDVEVKWQELLVPLAECIRFDNMEPVVFAKNVEALDPMLPKLRQVIYAARRRRNNIVRTAADGAPEDR